MTYPREWMASPDPDVESGTATYMVEGVKYKMRLDSFEDFGAISSMLDAAFKQGKVFAAEAVRGQIQRALDAAEFDHDLS